MQAAPAVQQNPRKILSSEWEHCNVIVSELGRAIQVRSHALDRVSRNFRAYTGLDGGAWTDEDLQQLDQEKRDALVFNVCRPKVDTLVGSWISEIFDFDYMPVQGERNSLIEKVKETYYVDKEMFDYARNIALVGRDACISFGEMKLELDRSINGLPYIRFRHKNPGFVVSTPNWITEDDKDRDALWDVFYLSASELKQFYQARGVEVEWAIEQRRKFGSLYENLSRDLVSQLERELKGDLYRVVEYHWLDPINTTRLTGRVVGENGQLSNIRVAFPMTKNQAVLEKFMLDNRIEPFSLYEVPYVDKIHMLTTVCPTLMSKPVLVQEKSEIQCGGRLPYFHLTTCRAGGEDLGIIDNIVNVQRTIDRRECKLTDLISTSSGGAKIVNWDVFKSPGDRRQFEQNNNDPSKIFWGDGVEMNKGKIVEYLGRSDYDPAIVNQIERMYDIVDRLSLVPAAMESMTESASEPGVVYEKKLQVAKVALRLITEEFRLFQNHLAEAYFYQWRISYNGPERTWTSRDGKKKTVLNERVAKDNKLYLRNVPSMAPRCAVIVTESPNSETQNIANRITLSQLYPVAAKANPEYATMLLSEFLRTMKLPDKTRARLEQIALLQEVRDLAKIKSEIANLDAGTQQAILSIMQSNQALQQMMMASGPEVPVQEVEQPMQGPGQAPAIQAPSQR